MLKMSGICSSDSFRGPLPLSPWFPILRQVWAPRLLRVGDQQRTRGPCKREPAAVPGHPRMPQKLLDALCLCSGCSLCPALFPRPCVSPCHRCHLFGEVFWTACSKVPCFPASHFVLFFLCLCCYLNRPHCQPPLSMRTWAL